MHNAQCTSAKCTLIHSLARNKTKVSGSEMGKGKKIARRKSFSCAIWHCSPFLPSSSLSTASTPCMCASVAIAVAQWRCMHEKRHGLIVAHICVCSLSYASRNWQWGTRAWFWYRVSTTKMIWREYKVEWIVFARLDGIYFSFWIPSGANRSSRRERNIPDETRTEIVYLFNWCLKRTGIQQKWTEPNDLSE